VHGPPWLENPTLSILLIAVGFYLLYRALQTEKHHRVHQQSEYGNIEREILGHKIIDTNRGWILFTLSIFLFAIGAHYLAENTFHVYDTTPVDRFTHGLSGMAIAAIVLNLYLTRRREYYYPMAIGVSWIAFILWEVYELIYIAYSGPAGFIQSDPWDWQ
jgi:Ca2+/Na+ antiporter